jgi:hypothetical protein
VAVDQKAKSADADNADNAAQRTAQAAADSDLGERLARIGLASRGAVFVVLGYLVVRIAFGALGSASSKHSASGPGVAQAIAAQPGGRVILVVLGVGLALFALFSALDAILHHDDEDDAKKRWANRAVAAIGVLVYGVFAVYCIYAAVSGSTSSGSAQQSDNQQTQWSAKVLNWPGGSIWLGLLALVLFGIAIFHVVEAIRRTFLDRLERGRMSARAWKYTVVTGTIGYLGRAALFASVGWFVMSAAIEDDPQHGQGFDGAARRLADNGVGGVFMVVVAAALICFGLYLFAEARYRKV